MKWLVRGFFGFAALAVLLGGVGVVLPSRVHVERAVVIDRPPATVFALVESITTTAEWSPWLRRAPQAEVVFDGPARGVGGRMAWTAAPPTVRAGALSIARIDPRARVESALDFGDRGTARLTVAVTPSGGGSEVSWIYEADLGFNLIARYAALGFGSRVAADLEAGLENLRVLAESLPGADFAGAGAKVVTVDPVQIVYAAGSVRGDAAAQADAFDYALDKVRDYMQDHDIAPDGPVIAQTLDWSPPAWAFRAAIPYAGAARTFAGDTIGFGQTWGGEAVRAIHRGPTSATAPLYAKLDAFIAAHRLEKAGEPWEVHVTDRATTPPDDQVTEIYVPVK